VEFQSEILQAYLFILYAHNSLHTAYNINFRRFKFIGITVMPRSDFGVLENVQAIRQQITPFMLK